jgi:hypothetical protein
MAERFEVRREVSSRKDKSQEDSSRSLGAKRQYALVITNVFLAAVFSAVLLLFVTEFAVYLPRQADNVDLEQMKSVLMNTLLTMLVAGAAGGSLCNLRGFFTLIGRDGYFRRKLEVPYYIRPFTGAVTGLFTFFLGNLLVSSLSIDPANDQSWATLPGRLPYIAIALLAGFAAQEFTDRLKEVAKTVFSFSLSGDQENRSKDRD